MYKLPISPHFGIHYPLLAFMSNILQVQPLSIKCKEENQANQEPSSSRNPSIHSSQEIKVLSSIDLAYFPIGGQVKDFLSRNEIHVYLASFKYFLYSPQSIIVEIPTSIP